jgi:hypothetical protein
VTSELASRAFDLIAEGRKPFDIKWKSRSEHLT